MNNIRIALSSIEPVSTWHHPLPKRKTHKWLLRIIQPVYKWLKDFVPPDPVESVTYHAVEIKFDKYIDVIKNHAREIERTTGKRPKFLFMGRREYHEMTGEIMGEYPFFIGPYPENQLQVLGLQVIIVPWIDGLFCLPDLGEMRR